jgi:hypothetical protein
MNKWKILKSGRKVRSNFHRCGIIWQTRKCKKLERMKCAVMQAGRGKKNFPPIDIFFES